MTPRTPTPAEVVAAARQENADLRRQVAELRRDLDAAYQALTRVHVCEVTR